MPTESDSKKSTDSQRSLPGWLAKCGISIPNLSVRGRQGSPEGPNRPVMTVADSSKNIKRALSPLPSDTSPRKLKRKPSSVASKRTPIQYEEPKVVNMVSTEEPKAVDVAPPEEPKPPTDPMEREFWDFVKDENNATIKAYTTAREKLVQLEADNAWDREARDSASQNEQRAASIIRAIREYERKFVFGNLASEAIPGPETLDMGGQFLTNKPRIDSRSELHKIAIKVPKGGLLHLHFNSELHPERLLERARLMENLYIRSIMPLTSEEALDKTEMVFNVLDKAKVRSDVDIFSADYPGSATNWKGKDARTSEIWMPWRKFQEAFKKHFPDEYVQSEAAFKTEVATCCSEPGQVPLSPAERWLHSKMVLSEKEAYGFDQTVNGVWARFNQATRCFKGLLNYQKVYKWYIKEAIERMILENVMYAELRPMLLDKYIPTDDGKGQIDNSGQMRLILEAVKEKRAELKDKKEEHKFPFGLKIIYCTPRSIPPIMMLKEMVHCIKLKLEFPELICGFDLVGAEDRENNIGHYMKELAVFKQMCEEKKVDIPFLFHAGESLLDMGGTLDPNNSNLFDAVALNAKRIGHGFSLMKHPHLVEQFRKNKICVELCPISNELLHLCRNIKEHPYPELLAAGIPCTVNSDNPSLFSNSMAHEFYQIMVGAPSMSLYSWKQLARWSIDYSCLSKEQKAEGHEHLNQAWKKFCSEVISTYGSIMDGDNVDVKRGKAFYEKCAHERS
ncbi:Metallo-dependent hydrolase [Ophiobolus disseminans]|uniref:Metallo-dependent hydrolase n=1 Tax=Ophiobolus disseminans TaxID=1469910 RepID=A0A6A6ZZE0_9PLEO|nr:Metallo-dependent hydrolase [Ophiobolus disseminans]